MKFWRLFNARFGPPGDPPESYWWPALGHVCHLRPSDVRDLTPAQLNGSYEAVQSFLKKPA